MSIDRYQPWSLMDQLRREMARMPPSSPGAEEGVATDSDWVPAVDIREEADGFIILADVPGVEPAAIEVHTENGLLTIAGERESEGKAAREGYKRVERSRGRFFRRFTLPDTADLESITAKSRNGVLEIRIPKLAQRQPRRISVVDQE